MAKLRVEWKETHKYSAVIEVDDFDPEDKPRQKIREAICYDPDGFVAEFVDTPDDIRWTVLPDGEG